MSATHPSADELLTAVTRALAPKLRALGFKGSGSSYVLPDDEWWLVLAIQRRAQIDSIHFTVNLTVANKLAWAADREYEPSLPARPSGNTSYDWDTETLTRLGNLTPPDGSDRWWEVSGQATAEESAREVGAAVEEFALPWFRDEIARKATSASTRAVNDIGGDLQTRQ